MSFQQYFKELRESKGLTQKELSEELNISLPTIKKIEGGFTKMPSHKLLSQERLYEIYYFMMKLYIQLIHQCFCNIFYHQYT